MLTEILSSLSAAQTSDYVYSSLSFFGRRRGGALPGRWFVEALAPLGVGESAIRQTLYRMEKSGALTGERRGRGKLYGPSPTTRAIMDSGRSQILEPAEEEWDGAWTIVHFRFETGAWQDRDRMRDVLTVEGFAALDPGLYLHPRDRAGRVREAAGEMGLRDHLFVFRGPRRPAGEEASMVRELWDLPAIRHRYRTFLDRFAGVRAGELDPLQAFGVRFAAVFEFFRIRWDDPEVPAELLPDDWPGEPARARAADLYRALEPGALEYADDVLERTGDASLPSTAGTSA